ncbi:Non-specific lipid-transfer protein [Euphorbia peplus]|nr:Non-specific lipid-transfer protein [Euphorbia peplus]
MKNFIVALLVTIFGMVFLGSNAVNPLPGCNGIVGEVAACVSYLSNTATDPSNECCDGIRFLANYADNQADRRSICQCLKNSISDFPQVDYSLFPSLTSTCAVNIVLPSITPDLDCSR